MFVGPWWYRYPVPVLRVTNNVGVEFRHESGGLKRVVNGKALDDVVVMM